jgi:Protein of unknown function (DUF2949)
MLERLINFLHFELKISQEAISLAKKTNTLEPHTLPIILWQYGFLNKGQLDCVFDWLEIA